MKELSENLKRLRESRNFSKSDLARLLNMAPSAYSAYETGLKSVGDREPNLKNLVKLAAFFNVSVDELLNHSVDEFKRCKDLWESANFKLQSKEGKLYLKQLPIQGNYHTKGGGINLLYFGARPIIFDSVEDFIEFTHKMEKSYWKEFIWDCRKFFSKMHGNIIGVLSDKYGPEIFEDEETENNMPLNYNLIKNKISK